MKTLLSKLTAGALTNLILLHLLELLLKEPVIRTIEHLSEMAQSEDIIMNESTTFQKDSTSYSTHRLIIRPITLALPK
jgi:hypothetical protein